MEVNYTLEYDIVQIVIVQQRGNVPQNSRIGLVSVVEARSVNEVDGATGRLVICADSHLLIGFMDAELAECPLQPLQFGLLVSNILYSFTRFPEQSRIKDDFSGPAMPITAMKTSFGLFSG